MPRTISSRTTRPPQPEFDESPVESFVPAPAPPMRPLSARPSSGRKPRRWVPIIVVVILLGAGGYVFATRGGWLGGPVPTAADETADLVSRVGKHLVLPENETPTSATVTDLSKLKDQPFFAKAKIGDRVLIYTTSRKAILYDPVADLIVEVAPVTFNAAATGGGR